MSDENKPDDEAGTQQTTPEDGGASDATPRSGEDARAGTAATGAAAAGTAATGPKQAPISFLHQYIKDFSFEAPNAPKVFQQSASQPQVNVKVDVTGSGLEDNVFESAIHLEIKAHDGESTIYLIELVYAGLIRLNDVPHKDVEMFVLIEAPRLLFPFARSLIASVTREGGFAPLVLTPFDFVDLYRRRVEARNAQAAQSPQSPQTPQSPQPQTQAPETEA